MHLFEKATYVYAQEIEHYMRPDDTLDQQNHVVSAAHMSSLQYLWRMHATPQQLNIQRH